MKSSMNPSSVNLRTERPEYHMVRVFPAGPDGGNPAPIGLGCDGMTDEELRAVAARYGHESGFVMATERDDADFRIRFFVPNHEMEMCGHATVGALWLMRSLGYLAPGTYVIETLSGLVRSHVPAEGDISVSQPAGNTEILSAEASVQVLGVLGLDPSDLFDHVILNTSTSRVKTLVPVRSVERLQSLVPDFSRMEAVCSTIGSTGLYPFAAGARQGEFHASQFPRSSGYPEDAATGIAASALCYGLLHYDLISPGAAITVRQGEAMGRPSSIRVSLSDTGCELSGACVFEPT